MIPCKRHGILSYEFVDVHTLHCLSSAACHGQLLRTTATTKKITHPRSYNIDTSCTHAHDDPRVRFTKVFVRKKTQQQETHGCFLGRTFYCYHTRTTVQKSTPLAYATDACAETLRYSPTCQKKKVILLYILRLYHT